MRFTLLGGGAPMNWREVFVAKDHDGMLVLHLSRVARERHAGCPDENTLQGAVSAHTWMATTHQIGGHLGLT